MSFVCSAFSAFLVLELAGLALLLVLVYQEAEPRAGNSFSEGSSSGILPITQSVVFFLWLSAIALFMVLLALALGGDLWLSLALSPNREVFSMGFFCGTATKAWVVSSFLMLAFCAKLLLLP